MFCSQCGKEYAQRVNYCCDCGAELTKPAPWTNKKLTRSRTDHKIAGVCGGFAQYLDLDVTLVRIIWLMLALVGGWGLIGYLIAWIAMPEEPLHRAEPASTSSTLPQPAGTH